MTTYHELNKYLPEELTILTLEWTGGDYKQQMDAVIEEVSLSKWVRINKRFYDFIDENTIWSGGEYLGLHPDEIIGFYTESCLFNFLDTLEEMETIPWNRIEEILNTVSELGWSLYEAIDLTYHYVLDEPLTDEDGLSLVQLYEENL